jgi:hypothetical protein
MQLRQGRRAKAALHAALKLQEPIGPQTSPTMPMTAQMPKAE